MTIIVFCLSGLSLSRFVSKEFFPTATRPELIVDMTLPQGASIAETEKEAQKLAKQLDGDKNIVNYTYYVGRSAPRFVLSLEPGIQGANCAQFIIVTKDVEARNKLSEKVNKLFDNGFEKVNSHVKIIQNGPPSNYPVMIRVAGNDMDQVKEIAAHVSDIMHEDPNLCNVNYDWFEKIKVMQIEIDQDKARALGLDTQQLSGGLQAQISGKTVSQFREDDKTIDIVLKADSFSSTELSNIKNLSLPLSSGEYVPLDQIAKLSYGAEEGLIARRNLKPTITVQAEVVPGVTGNDTAEKVFNRLRGLKNDLPYGYSIEMGGTLWNEIIDSAVLRFRPIMLTALTSILGLIPLIPNAFWGPMAIAMSGGLFVATVLTLLVLPAIYAAWYRVEYRFPDQEDSAAK